MRIGTFTVVEVPERIRRSAVDTFGISTGAKNALKNAGKSTIGDLLDLDEKGLRRVPFIGSGKKRIQEVREALQQLLRKELGDETIEVLLT